MPSADGKGYALTWSEISKRYPETEFIHVLPASDMLFATPRPDYRLDVAIVKIPPTKQFVYPIEKRNERDGDGWKEVWISVGLLKAALERIIAAAEISAVPRRTDDRRDPLFASYEAFAVMQGPTGAMRTRVASKAWKGELARERKLVEAESKMQRYLTKGWKLDSGKPAKQATPDEIKAQVDLWFRSEWIREREFGPETAESKAVGRAVRALLGIPAKFTPEELETKSFLIPRWVFDPDVSDPAIRRMMIEAGLNARLGVFALAALQATPDVKLLGPAPATAGPPAATVDLPEEDPEPAEAEAEIVDDPEPGPERKPEPKAKPVDRVTALLDTLQDMSLDDLTLEIARASIAYKKPDAAKVRARWEKAISAGDAETMRSILRYILTGEGTK